MNEDLIIQKIIKLEEDMKEVKERLGKLDSNMDVLINGQDRMIRILERVDQERAFTNARMERFEKQGLSGEERIMKLEKDMQTIKQHLQLA